MTMPSKDHLLSLTFGLSSVVSSQNIWVPLQTLHNNVSVGNTRWSILFLLPIKMFFLNCQFHCSSLALFDYFSLGRMRNFLSCTTQLPFFKLGINNPQGKAFLTIVSWLWFSCVCVCERERGREDWRYWFLYTASLESVKITTIQ